MLLVVYLAAKINLFRALVVYAWLWVLVGIMALLDKLR